MRAVRFHEVGGPDVLQVDEVPKPTPGDEEILVEIKAAAVNPVETYVRSDWDEYPPSQLPQIVGADFSGVVVETGADVTRFEVGDHVFAATGRSGMGGYAEYIAVDADICARLPDGVDFEQGAGVGNAGGPAWQALTGRPALVPGMTCLIHGGSGGVGHIASQIASAAGLRVIATAGSDDRRDRLAEFGVDHAFNYTRDDLEATIGEAAEDGVDVILDPFPHLYLDLDIGVAAKNGYIVVYDKTDLSTSRVHEARGKNLAIWMTSFGTMHKGEAMRGLARLLAMGDLRIAIANRYPLEEAAEAHRALEEEDFVGRLIVTP